MAKMNVAKSGGPGKDAPSNRGPEQRSIDSAGSLTAFYPQDVWGADAGSPDEDDKVRTMTGGVGEAAGNDASTGAQGVPPSSHPVSKTELPLDTGQGKGSVIIKTVHATGDVGTLGGKAKPGDSGG